VKTEEPAQRVTVSVQNNSTNRTEWTALWMRCPVMVETYMAGQITTINIEEI